MGVCFAFHEVIVKRFASGADEEARAHERGGGGAEFFHGGNGVGERGGVEKDALVEAGKKG